MAGIAVGAYQTRHGAPGNGAPRRDDWLSLRISTGPHAIGWISSIGIVPAWQGRLGRALLLAGERALGTSLVRLTVRASNARAIQLYEHAGYHQIQIARGYYIGGEDGLVFEKPRTQPPD